MFQLGQQIIHVQILLNNIMFVKKKMRIVKYGEKNIQNVLEKVTLKKNIMKES